MPFCFLSHKSMFIDSRPAFIFVLWSFFAIFLRLDVRHFILIYFLFSPSSSSSILHFYLVDRRWTYLMQKLHINDAKHKDKFVEDKIPELVFQVLLFGYSQFAEYQFLDRFAQQNETTICHIDDRLQRNKKKKKFLLINYGAKCVWTKTKFRLIVNFDRWWRL